MNRLKYGEIAVGAPGSQKRFEALCLDLRNADPDSQDWLDYAAEIAAEYPNRAAYIEVEDRNFILASLNGEIRIIEDD